MPPCKTKLSLVALWTWFWAFIHNINILLSICCLPQGSLLSCIQFHSLESGRGSGRWQKPWSQVSPLHASYSPDQAGSSVGSGDCSAHPCLHAEGHHNLKRHYWINEYWKLLWSLLVIIELLLLYIVTVIECDRKFVEKEWDKKWESTFSTAWKICKPFSHGKAEIYIMLFIYFMGEWAHLSENPDPGILTSVIYYWTISYSLPCSWQWPPLYHIPIAS